jgi:hypothetical protein
MPTTVLEKPATAQLLDQAFERSIFDAFANRRSRRFGLGYSLKDGDFEYASKAPPVPLSEIETALLCWAAHGIQGLALSEGLVATSFMDAWDSRTHAAPCNDQHTWLTFVNDDGAFLYEPPSATRPVEITSKADRAKIVDIFEKHTRRLSATRPIFPKEGFLRANAWHINRPGGTWFLPVADLTTEYINFLLHVLEFEGYRIVDPAHDGKPCGLEPWIRSGHLAGPELPLLSFETFVYNVVIAQTHYKVQNIQLAAEALGLGAFVWSGFTPLIILGGTPLARGLEFRFVTGKDGMPNPVGRDGVMEAFCPPYVKDMDEAVDRVVAIKHGEGGLLAPDSKHPNPFKDWASYRKNVRQFNPETVAATRAYCRYVFETYGRFPAFFDTMQTPVSSTVHHVDIEYYDSLYPKEVLSEAIRSHMVDWHR